MRIHTALVLAAGFFAIAACGQTVEQVSGNKQGGDPTPGNGGLPSYPTPSVPTEPPPDDHYPADHPGMPQIPNNGGDVLHDPVIITVTFPNDDLQAQIDQFDDQVGGLNWWQVNAEYGVGKATSGDHVKIAQDLPTSMTDVDVEQWLQDRINDQTLPAPTDQMIYALYIPAATTISFSDGSGTSCAGFLGYHSSINMAVNNLTMPIAYAVINRCGGIDSVTETASHEFTEACTDPHPFTGPGYTFFKDNAWTVAGGEDGDMCSMVSGVTEAGWSLTRVWSNKNAKAGDQPCMPLPAQAKDYPYFNAGVVHDTLTAHPGDTVKTEVDCYSFGKLPNDITVDVQPYSPTILKPTLSAKTCKNGDKLTLTFNVAKTAKKGTDYHYDVQTNINANTGHIWRGMVSVN